jgi:cytochrome c peroxidase
MDDKRLDPWHWISVMVLALLTGSTALSDADAPDQCAKHQEVATSASSPSTHEVEGFALTLRVFFKPLPEKMPGGQDDTPEKVALGRKLYFERGISLNKTQSCNDCHLLDQKRAGVDYLPTSKGAKGTFGTRNAPTVLNAGFQAAQFWDGRAADLVEQAKGPVLNPIEMGMRSPEDVVNRLKDIEDYRRAFASAFPGEAEPMTYDNVARAIAAFERTLMTPSRFDRYLKGDRNALTRGEEQGLHRFVDTGCVECHSSYTLGGRLLQKLGFYHAYANQKDLGRYDVTRKEEDRHVFKVPMLRNVTLTAPYFHDGQVTKLEEAVRLMAWMQLDTVLTPPQIDEIVRFLRSLEAEHPVDHTGS